MGKNGIIFHSGKFQIINGIIKEMEHNSPSLQRWPHSLTSFPRLYYGERGEECNSTVEKHDDILPGME